MSAAVWLCLCAWAPGAGAPARDANRYGVVIRWNTLARELVAEARMDPPMASRLYAILSVAQSRACQAAPLGRVSADASGASLEVLGEFFPGSRTRLAALAEDAGGASGKGAEAARRVLQERSRDGSAEPWSGQPPQGEGMWTGTQPLRPGWGRVAPWLPGTASRFIRPAPAPGSPEFLAGLEEVRRISRSRTAGQLGAARRHAFGPGTSTPPGFWNEVAVQAILSTRWRGEEADRRGSQILAVLNIALMDAGITAWRAKYQAWLCRPSQADPSITLPIGLPPFPSYVSGHSAFSGAASRVLGAAFPPRASQYAALAEEASISRVYGGIHYPFDCAEGLRLGREIGDEAAALLK